MPNVLPSFQRYQQDFCAHLRDPIKQPRPKNVPIERMAVYKEVVFNNLFESVSACFPVAQKVLGKRAWLKLTKHFFCEHSATSPIFREIPEEFLAFLSTQADLSVYLTDLCHYEWIELLVSLMKTSTRENDIDKAGDLLKCPLAFTPTMQLLEYNYPVQKISARYQPKEKVKTQLLVYRNAEDAVKFIELNPVTHRLIGLLQQSVMTGEQALTIIAKELHQGSSEKTLQFGLVILEQLKSQGVILGTKILC